MFSSISQPTYVIGDVHGCIFTLEKLIKQFPKDSKIVFVGDLVDRGKYSKEVLEFVIQNNYQTVLGNHEYLFLEYANDAFFGKDSMWSSNKAYGGEATIKSYKNDYDSFQKHRLWIKTLPLCIDFQQYFITHAFCVNLYANRFNEDYKHKIFTKYIEDVDNNLLINQPKNIFGHQTHDQIVKHPFYFGIDTGCVYGNKLSAIELYSENIFSVDFDVRDC